MRFRIAGSLCALVLFTGFTLMPSAGVEGTRWRQFPIRFRFNAANAPFAREQVSRILTQALELWNGVDACALHVELGEITRVTASQALSGGTQENVIVFDQKFKKHFPETSRATLAVGRAFKEGGDYVRGVIVINAVAAATADPERLKIIVAHEAGHVFGIGHAAERSSLMFPVVREVGKLGDDDIAAITFLYPRKEGLGTAPLGCATVRGADELPPGRGSLMMLGMFLFWPFWRKLQW